MKQIYSFYIFIAFCMAMCACSDETIVEVANPSVSKEGKFVEAALNVSVLNHDVSVQSGSRALTEDEIKEEKEGLSEEYIIHNLWVFQFDQNGNIVKSTNGNDAMPKYIPIGSQEELKNIPIKLLENEPTTIYVVANTNDANWGTELKTLASLRSATIPNPEVQYLKVKGGDEELSLPMEGSLSDVTVTEYDNITVTVIRMFAKLKIKVVYGEAVSDMTTQSIGIRNLPEYCPIQATVKDDESGAVDYPTNIGWMMEGINTVDDEKDMEYIVYVPENRQGRTEIPDGYTREQSVTGKTLALDITSRTDDGSDCIYTVFPGEDMNMADFNITRNHVYLITVNIKSKPERVPSSNCFVAAPGQPISFWPYVREEVGGGYDILSYINPDVLTLAIDKVKILWQTKDAIGDNETNTLVWMTGSGMDTKIHVKTNKEGNAVIAAYNEDDKIVWSWHIWVTDFAPDNVGNQVDYTTYMWDNKSIYTGRRNRGTPVMKYNLGAFSDEKSVHEPTDTETKAFGLLYQWGRKDPFPPLRGDNKTYKVERLGRTMPYTIDCTEPLFDNAHQPNIGMITSAQTTKKEMFYSLAADNNRPTLAKNNPILYTIQNPTVFMCGTGKSRPISQITDIKTDIQSYVHQAYIDKPDNYPYNGDWANFTSSVDKHQRWGAQMASTNQKYIEIGTDRFGKKVYMHDNYGPKSIFDPCPKGWTIPPGELWLGFTSTGYNPDTELYYAGADINWDYPTPPAGLSGEKNIDKWLDENCFDVYGAGLYMYMQFWRRGPKLYFPTQGTRAPDGYGFRVGSCGNYPNSTAEESGRVNTLHLHGLLADGNGFFSEAFQLFEFANFFYYAKSTGSPVRCVRERF